MMICLPVCYPKPGSLFHIEITRDDTTKVQEKDDSIEELQCNRNESMVIR